MLARLRGVHALLGRLLYGTGMRIMEGVRLRVKDVDFARREILIRDGKGFKDRVTMLPRGVVAAAAQRTCAAVREQHELRSRGRLRRRLAAVRARAQVSGAAREWAWQYVFPADRRSPRSAQRHRAAASPERPGVPARDAAGGARCRDRQARRRRTRCGIRSRRICSNRATTSAPCRSCSGTRTCSTTMIYTHVLNRGGRGVVSPLDGLGTDGRGQASGRELAVTAGGADSARVAPDARTPYAGSRLRERRRGRFADRAPRAAPACA